MAKKKKSKAKKQRSGPIFDPIAVGEMVGGIVVSLIALAVGYSTYTDFMVGEKMSVAYQAYALGENGFGPARGALDSIASAAAGDPDYHALSGSVFLMKEDQHAQADRAFKQVLATAGDPNLGALGQGVAGLYAADATDDPAKRQAAITEALGHLDGAGGTAEVSALVSKAGALALEGKATDNRERYLEALNLLKEVEELIGSRGVHYNTLLAFHWNRGVVAMLAGQYGVALDSMQIVQEISPFRFDPYGRAASTEMFYKALVYGLTDASADPVTQLDRAKRARGMLDAVVFSGTRQRVSRWGFDRQKLPELWNAVGFAFYTAQDYAGANEALDTAYNECKRRNRDDALLRAVRLNLAQAAFLHVRSAVDESDSKAMTAKSLAVVTARKMFTEAARAEEDATVRYVAYLNAGAVMQVDQGLAVESLYEEALKDEAIAKDKKRQAEIQYRLGISHEHIDPTKSLPHYREARKLGHPQSFKISQRIEKIERGPPKRGATDSPRRRGR